MVQPLGARPSYGSNGWTVPAQRSASGMPMVACDTHLAPSLPCTWHRTEARFADRSVAGFSIPGLPMVLIGANGSLAWGLTNLPGDTLDLVELEDAGPVITTVSETIRVRGRAPQSIQHDATVEGPKLVLAGDREPLVLRWSGLWPGSIDLGLAALPWCNTLEEALEVTRSSGGPPVYFHLADRSGGTALTIAGRIPRRHAGRLWPGVYEAPAEKPVEFGMDAAPLVSANDEKRAGSPFRGKGWNHPAGHRARRIKAALRTRTDWREADLLALQLDVDAAHLEPFHRLARTALDGPPALPWPAGSRERAASATEAWDGRFSVGSVAMPGIQAFADRLTGVVLSPFIEACRRYRPDFSYSWRDSESVVLAVLASEDATLLGHPEGTAWQACLDQRLLETVLEVERRHRRPVGVLTWGDTRRRIVSHPVLERLFGGVLARLGGLRLPRASASDCVLSVSPYAIPMQRLVVAPGCEERALVSMVGGQSESPLSRHYRDHHRTWLDGGGEGLLTDRSTWASRDGC